MKSSGVVCGYNPQFSHFYFLQRSSFSSKQHIRHCVSLGDELCPRPEMVDFILRPEPSVEKKVLDIGQSPVCSREGLTRFTSFQLSIRVWKWYLVSTSRLAYFNFDFILRLSSLRTTSMARKYHHVQVIGIDLAPGIQNEADVPTNCQFQRGDVNKGLPDFYGQVDVIHMRSVCAGVSPRCRFPFPKNHPVQSSVLLCCIFSNTIRAKGPVYSP
jgi:hypothetical protein